MQYIVLQNGSFRRAFKVLRDNNYLPRLKKYGSEGVTVTGQPDFEVGPIVRKWRYTLKILEGEAGTNVSHPAGTDITATSTQLGSLADIKTFFGYNTVSTMLDVDETEHEVLLSGNLDDIPRGPYIKGPNAIFNIQVTIKKTDAV